MSESLNVPFMTPEQGADLVSQQAGAEAAVRQQAQAEVTRSQNGRPQLTVIEGGKSETGGNAEAASDSVAQPTPTKPEQHNRRGRRVATRPQGPPNTSESAGSAETKPSGVGRGNGVTHKRDHLRDVISDEYYDESGRVRYRHGVDEKRDEEGNLISSSKNMSSRFMTKKHLEMIEEHADQIREGLEGRDTPGEPTPPIVPGPEPLPGGGGNGPRGPEMSGEDFIDGDYMREMPHELAQEVAIAQNEFMNMVAAMSTSTFRGRKAQATLSYLIENGQVARDGNGEPIVNDEKVRASMDELLKARDKYEAARERAKFWTVNRMIELGVAPADRMAVLGYEDLTENDINKLGIKFAEEDVTDRKHQRFMAEEDQSRTYKMRGRFYNWWARQGGGDKFFSKQRMKGMAKKGAVIAIAGVPLGVAAGAAGAFLAGPLAGGVAAAAIAKGVSRGLLRGKIEKNAASRTVSNERNAVSHAAVEQRIQGAYRREDIVDSITDEYVAAAEHGRGRNRRRALGSVAIGAVAGLGGAFAGEAIHNAIWGGHHPQQTVKGLKPSKVPAKPGPKTPQVNPVELKLDHSGDSVWSEVSKYANAHGEHLTQGQAHHVVGEVLKDNHLTWKSAHNMAIGQKFALDEHIQHELENYKEAA